MVVLPKMSKQAHQNQKPLGNFPSGMMFMVARPTVMCNSITCLQEEQVGALPHGSRSLRPTTVVLGREVCNPQAETGSQ